MSDHLADEMNIYDDPSPVNIHENDYDDEEYDGDDYGQQSRLTDNAPRTLPNTNFYSLQRIRSTPNENLAHRPPHDIHGSAKHNLTSNQSISTENTNAKEGLSAFPIQQRAEHTKYSNNNTNFLGRGNVQDTRCLVAVPAYDTQERLRSQLDLLKDVKIRAGHEQIYDGFPIGLESKLGSLRQAHTKLLQLLRERTAKIEEQKRHEINANVLANIPTTVTSNSLRNDTLSNTNAVAGTSKNGMNTAINGTPFVRTKSAAPAINPEETKYIQQLVDIARGLR